jgi:hypothetical protein
MFNSKQGNVFMLFSFFKVIKCWGKKFYYLVIVVVLKKEGPGAERSPIESKSEKPRMLWILRIQIRNIGDRACVWG